MTPEGFALAATIILLFPMLYFQLASPAFLMVKLTIPTVTRLLRGMFSTHFMIVSVVGAIGTLAFALAGKPLMALGLGVIAAFAIGARRWFLREMDAGISARDAGDAEAVRRLRRLHWGGMAYNAVQLGAIVVSIPYVFVMPT